MKFQGIYSGALDLAQTNKPKDTKGFIVRTLGSQPAYLPALGAVAAMQV